MFTTNKIFEVLKNDEYSLTLHYWKYSDDSIANTIITK